jgi:hypothetical protein
VQNEGNATGTAFAISYNSDISKVTMENLVVFTVAEHSKSGNYSAHISKY